MKTVCCTALITPFRGESVDSEGIEKLISFQLQNGMTGILAVGTTGESPVLSWQEHHQHRLRVGCAHTESCFLHPRRHHADGFF